MAKIKVLSAVALFVIAISVALVAAAQVAPVPADREEPAATANIPFEFFVGSDRLPQGEYALGPMSAGIVLFHNKKTGQTAQTFTSRFAQRVEVKDARLVFVHYKEQYRFVGIRGISGTWRATEYYLTDLPEGAVRHEIPITYLEHK